ncbi:MAG: hypothetical protein QXQ50_07815 [Candidatus Bathyarchaeia archaeon]
MPYKNKEQYRRYIRQYMRKYYRQQQKRMLELRQKFPDVYSLIFGSPKRSKRKRRKR